MQSRKDVLKTTELFNLVAEIFEAFDSDPQIDQEIPALNFSVGEEEMVISVKRWPTLRRYGNC